jgi:hypothetical protein
LALYWRYNEIQKIKNNKLELEYESDSEYDSEYEYAAEYVAEYVAESEVESEVESETDYSDMPELISMEQLEVIKNLCKSYNPFINNQDLQNILNEIPIYSIDSDEEDEEDEEDN